MGREGGEGERRVKGRRGKGRGEGRAGEGRGEEGRRGPPMTLWHGAPNVLIRPCAKHYENPTMLSKVTAKMSGMFFKHTVQQFQVK